MIRWLAAACRAKQSLVMLAIASIVVLTACSTRSAGPNASSGTPSTAATRGGAAPSLPSTPTPSAKKSPSLAAPFPKASPVTVAGWLTLTSRTWDGYQFPVVSGVTGVRAQWTQPLATGPADEQAAVWVGIGRGQPDLIQAGTTDSPPYLGVTYDRIWYELLPARPYYPPAISVAPGDKIAVSIAQLRPPQEKWQISIYNISFDQTFTKIVQYRSDGAYPAFIVEDPVKNLSQSSSALPFSHWGAVSFSNMQIRIGDQWKPAASIYGWQIQMVRNGRTLATAGPLDTASGFTAHQGP